MQITQHILMIRPVRFRKNEQTAVNNFFQMDLATDDEILNRLAQEEFDAFVAALREQGIHVLVIHDIWEQNTPDSIFPNNWVSFHKNGSVVFYPMFAENRRRERREDLLDHLVKQGFFIERKVDYSVFEAEEKFLEGTGSMIMDRVKQKIYCALSERADRELVERFCLDFGCTPVVFTANQTVGNVRKPIYHTNVMMALAEEFTVICLESIDNLEERESVVAHLTQDGKEIIDISEAQVHQFAGNMLQVLGANDQRFTVMSTAAFRSLTQDQETRIRNYGGIIHSPLDTIETCGGGSARCMMAEVFLPIKIKERSRSKQLT